MTNNHISCHFTTYLKALITCCVFMTAGTFALAKTTLTPESSATLTQPAEIWIYPFVASNDEIPHQSAFSGLKDITTEPMTADELALGQKIGAATATELVREIREMGLSASLANADSKPAINDIVLHGYLLAIHEGEQKKRIIFGLGAGASELKTAVEAFQMTTDGLHPIGAASNADSGGKTPGVAVGAVGLVATHNPAGLIISTGIKLHGAHSGGSKIKGRAKDTAKEIAKALKERFEAEAWIL